MTESEPRATIEYIPGQLDAVLSFLKQTRYDFRTLRLVRVWPDRLQGLDVNGDSFLVRGLGYQSPDVVPVLDALNAVYRPETLHEPTSQEYKEFKTGKRYTWAADRVM